jgi:transcription initiation factor IIE alpha subunit
MEKLGAKELQMDTMLPMAEALARLKTVFRETAGAELTDTDVAELVGIDDDDCRVLLRMLEQTGVIEQPRNRVFVSVPSRQMKSATIGS